MSWLNGNGKQKYKLSASLVVLFPDKCFVLCGLAPQATICGDINKRVAHQIILYRYLYQAHNESAQYREKEQGSVL